MKLRAIIWTTACLLCSATVSAEFETKIPVEATGSGSFIVTAEVGASTADQFLLDTGANLSAISGKFFKRIKATNDVEKVRRVATRLANGKLNATQVYRVETLKLAGQCEISPFEFVVMESSQRNLLGMSALAQVAPFAFHVAPAAIGVSGCQSDILSGNSFASN